MLTLKEIETFAHLLDKEYEDEIKPILTASYTAIDDVLKLVNSDEFENMRKRANFDYVKFDSLNFDMKPIMYALGYHGYEHNHYRIEHSNIPSSLISKLGYSEVAYNINDGLMSLFYRSDEYRGNIVAMTDTITQLKKEFERIKRAYIRFFIDDNGSMFKDFIKEITERYNRVRDVDKKSDNDLYALFNQSLTPHKVKITITIEDV